MKGKKARTLLLDALCMLAGSAVYAVEVNAFTAPNNIAAGGITGVATMLNYLWGTPIGLVSFLSNVPIVLWAVVDITHAGTAEDPIPAARGMEYEYGKIYLDPEDGKRYLCKRTGEAEGGKITLHYLPHELIGQYFEEVTA